PSELTSSPPRFPPPQQCRVVHICAGPRSTTHRAPRLCSGRPRGRTLGRTTDEGDSMLHVAINGLGRIGRAYLRALVERDLFDTEVRVVGGQHLWDAATL